MLIIVLSDNSTAASSFGSEADSVDPVILDIVTRRACEDDRESEEDDVTGTSGDNADVLVNEHPLRMSLGDIIEENFREDDFLVHLPTHIRLHLFATFVFLLNSIISGCQISFNRCASHTMSLIAESDIDLSNFTATQLPKKVAFWVELEFKSKYLYCRWS